MSDTSPAGGEPRERVLIVDDEEQNRALLRAHLAPLYATFEAPDGQAAQRSRWPARRVRPGPAPRQARRRRARRRRLGSRPRGGRHGHPAALPGRRSAARAAPRPGGGLLALQRYHSLGHFLARRRSTPAARLASSRPRSQRTAGERNHQSIRPRSRSADRQRRTGRTTADQIVAAGRSPGAPVANRPGACPKDVVCSRTEEEADRLSNRQPDCGPIFVEGTR